ncbi:MAG TPA: hypothetical protein VNT42_10510 [Sphingomonas sp.]|nr:hypothetical protein [Sphingomonas sp.]
MVADIIGLIGGGIMVAAFAYSNITKAVNLVLFNLLNLVGAAMLIASLLIHYNMPSKVISISWSCGGCLNCWLDIRGL